MMVFVLGVSPPADDVPVEFAASEPVGPPKDVTAAEAVSSSSSSRLPAPPSSLAMTEIQSGYSLGVTLVPIVSVVMTHPRSEQYPLYTSLAEKT